MTLVSTADVHIAMPARYLGQLCKHFGHRVPMTLDGDRGSITFPFGTCVMSAAEETLWIRLEAPDATDLDELEGVIRSHLERFTWKDQPAIAFTRQKA